MRALCSRWLLAIGLAGGSLIAAADPAAADPQVRDHRGPRPPHRYDYDQPREAPPAPRAERVARRPGYVWIQGSWNWQRGRGWVWTNGHWDRPRAGKRWRADRWERRGATWVRISGAWEDDASAAYPTTAPPPPPRDRAPRLAPGKAWVPGHFIWRDGRYQWKSGYIAPARPGQRFQPGEWVRRGGRYEWIEGNWVDDYPTSAPPPPRAETRERRRGQVFRRGHWEWRAGRWAWQPGVWVPARRGQRFRDGRWDNRGGRWTWVEGGWEAGRDVPDAPAYDGPTEAPPPPPRAEPHERKDGFIWARGHYVWKNGRYEWVNGHWERPRARKRWVDSHWERRGRQWVFVEGGWQ